MMEEKENIEPMMNPEDLARLKLVNALVSTNRTLPDDYKEMAYQQIQHRTGLGQRQFNFRWRQVLSYAAILVLAFGLSYIVWDQFSGNAGAASKFAQVVVPPGQTANVILPDGTEVVLNASSKLTYPTVFDRKVRAVSLEGEGYFSVTTNKHKPFIVKTDVYDVRVTGTRFNLSAYDNEPYTTVLIEGEVYIDMVADGSSLKLLPGEAAVWSKNENKLRKQFVKTDLYTNWQDGVIQFRNEKMENVAHYMERWYNVEVVFAREAAKAVSINGTLLKNKPVDQMLAVLKLTGQIDYSISYYGDKKTVITLK